MAPATKKQKLSNGTASTTAVEEVQEPQSASAQDAELDEKASDSEHQRSLFVRALPPTTTSDSLTALFSDSYPIKHATAVIDKETQTCKGYGFVTFTSAEDAQNAKKQFHGHVLDGRRLRIEIAEKRHRGDAETGTSEKKAKPEREKEVQQPTKLIVRNLPWTIKGSNQLEKLFLSYGKVKQAYVPKKGPGLMAGFGFVVMRGRKNAEKAMEGVNGKEVDGRVLAVDWAVEKETYQGLQQKESGEDQEETVKNEEDGDEDGDEEGAEGHIDDMSSDESDEAGDEDDVDVDIDGSEDLGDDDGEDKQHDPEDRSTTLFVRNLPFTCTDEDLEDHFTQFGPTRYARIVLDYSTGRSKGTGFICFYNKEDADACLRGAPRSTLPSEAEKSKLAGPSILQNDTLDPTGKYTLDSRVLQLSRAVDKREANRLTSEGVSSRHKRDGDKRRLYLLREGTIASNSKLWESLAPSERTMREASAKQRKMLIESNPSLHLSLTRLSVRNIPRSINSKDLKALAREAVVGFATDVKEGKRERLSKEELARDAGSEAEAARKKAGKGIVRQAKVVFEGAGGSKVSEDSGAGRSRGYGFIEYYTHRSALMGLRWLNGHAVGYRVQENQGGKKGASRPSAEEFQDRKKRLIVEFAIENAQVVLRRNEREGKARERSLAVKNGTATDDAEDTEGGEGGKNKHGRKPLPSQKRKRGEFVKANAGKGKVESKKPEKKPVDEKIAKRNQIIGRKRAMRKARKGGK